jgi:hypothetical protein
VVVVTAAAWDVATCERQVRRLAALADDLDWVCHRLLPAAEALGWTGLAATQARARIGRAGGAVSVLTGLVRQAAEAVWLSLPGLAEAVLLARTPPQDPADQAQASALAKAIDVRTASALAVVRSGPNGGQRRLRLPSGALPREVALWWAALPPHLRDAAVARWPDAVGRLAGVPGSVRDAANRIVLSRLIRALRAQRASLDRTVRTDPGAVRLSAEVTVRLRLAEGIEGQLVELEKSGTRATLLTVDLDGAGRVAIGVGDLDSARHVAVVVPGMGQDAGHGLDRTVQQAVRLRDCATAESGQPVATVAWAGYAAPGLLQVPFSARARAGGRLLAADLLALTAGRRVAGVDPPHLTVVGHSYGSTVVGAAATSGCLPADDLVLLGSPGVLAEHVDELNHPPAHVYVGEARFDPVADVGAFGADPGDASFGATRIGAEPGPDVPWRDRLSGGDHSHYYDPASESLRNIARIVVGRGADVSRPAG